MPSRKGASKRPPDTPAMPVNAAVTIFGPSSVERTPETDMRFAERSVSDQDALPYCPSPPICPQADIADAR
jgi:hypothetical protein